MFSSYEAVLVVVDVQGKLAQVVDRPEYHLENIIKMIRGAALLAVPVLLTEQAPEKIGATLPEVTALLPDATPIARTHFSCWREPAFINTLGALQRRHVLLCGYEAHICIWQTAKDLLEQGYAVTVLADCVSSRASFNAQIALQQLATCGAQLLTVEMVLFAMLNHIHHPKFKEISRLIR